MTTETHDVVIVGAGFAGVLALDAAPEPQNFYLRGTSIHLSQITGLRTLSDSPRSPLTSTLVARRHV